MYLLFDTETTGLPKNWKAPVTDVDNWPRLVQIAWLTYEDYAKAGYYLLPTGKKDSLSAFLAVMYAIWMTLVSVVPYFGFTKTLFLSTPAAIIALLLGGYLIFKAIKLYKEQSDKSARSLMMASIIYLPLLQILYVVDKFLR